MRPGAAMNPVDSAAARAAIVLEPVASPTTSTAAAANARAP